MKGVAQQNRVTSKPSRGVGVARPQPRAACVGAGNRHRAGALEVPGILQAKLTIGKANDPFEQEADRVADAVMRMPEPFGGSCAASDPRSYTGEKTAFQRQRRPV